MFRGYLTAIPLGTVKRYIVNEMPREFDPVVTTYLQQAAGYYMSLTLEDGTIYHLFKESKSSTHAMIGMESPEGWFFSRGEIEKVHEVARRYNCADFAELKPNESMRERLFQMSHKLE